MSALLFPLQISLPPPFSSTPVVFKEDLTGFGGSGLNCVAQTLNPNSAHESIVAGARKTFSPGTFYAER